jgi:hypothetical protein
MRRCNMLGQKPRIFSFRKRREGGERGDVSFFSSQNEGNSPPQQPLQKKKPPKFL